MVKERFSVSMLLGLRDGCDLRRRVQAIDAPYFLVHSPGQAVLQIPFSNFPLVSIRILPLSPSWCYSVGVHCSTENSSHHISVVAVFYL